MDKVIKNITPLTYKFIGNESPYKAWPPLARYLHGASTFFNWNAYNIEVIYTYDNPKLIKYNGVGENLILRCVCIIKIILILLW